MRRLLAVAGAIRAAARRIRAQPLKALARGLRVLPRPLRRVAAVMLPLAAPRRGRGAAIHLVAHAVGRGRDLALGRAEATARDAQSDHRTRIALARGALAVDGVPSAARILETLGSAGDEPAALALRADVALRTGRFRDAGVLARRARAAGARGAALDAVERRAEGELRVLEPGWRPALEPAKEPVARTAGRILHLVTSSLPQRQTGYAVRTQSIARAQRQAGLDPHVATEAGFPANHGILAAAPVDVVEAVPYHRLAPGFDQWHGADATTEETAREAARLLERLRPAALHPASHFRNGQAALALRDRYGLPVVYEVRGFLEETWISRQASEAPRIGGAAGTPGSAADADRYRGARAAETAVMHAADAVVTLSETMRADIVARGIDPGRVTVVPNAVDVDRFTPRERNARLAARLGLPDDVPVLGYVSSLNGYEGIRYLIEAGALLRDRGRGVRVLLVGEGEERAALENQARELGLADGTVVFTGRVAHDEVLDYYSLIDVFVVPRTADRVSRLVTPLKPYEAMAMQLPLVVSGVDALREIVTDGETGLVVEPENAVSLADTVEPLLDDPEARARLGRQARAWVAAERTWRHNAATYLELYRRLGAA